MLNFNNKKIQEHMFEGGFGLEKESLRIDENGYLAHTPHPYAPDPHIERDFCENQTELITPVCSSAKEVFESLASLHVKAVKTLYNLDAKEYLWPFSNPPFVLGEDDVPIAEFEGELRDKTIYRKYLAKKYGKKRMLYSGIHFNYSFSDDLLQAGFEESDMTDFTEYKNQLYLELAKKVTQYSWLIVYLTSASSMMDGSFFDEPLGSDILFNLSSYRCSEIGYWNDFVPILNYDNLEYYILSIEDYVHYGQISNTSELYYPVRLKPRGINNLDNLKKYGINHIELRMIDLNPLVKYGIEEQDIRFMQLLILYLVSYEDYHFTSYQQIRAVNNEKESAKYEDITVETKQNIFVPIKEEALRVLSEMEKLFTDETSLACLKFQKDKILDNKRYAVTVREQFKEHYVAKGVELIKEYAKELNEE